MQTFRELENWWVCRRYVYFDNLKNLKSFSFFFGERGEEEDDDDVFNFETS